MNNIHTSVVRFADNAPNKFEAGSLRLEGEKVEPFQDAEGCRSLRIDSCGWEPFSAEELEVWFLSCLAAAEVDVNFMNAVVINDHELIPEGSFGADTVFI